MKPQDSLLPECQRWREKFLPWFWLVFSFGRLTMTIVRETEEASDATIKAQSNVKPIATEEGRRRSDDDQDLRVVAHSSRFRVTTLYFAPDALARTQFYPRKMKKYV